MAIGTATPERLAAGAVAAEAPPRGRLAQPAARPWLAVHVRSGVRIRHPRVRPHRRLSSGPFYMTVTPSRPSASRKSIRSPGWRGLHGHVILAESARVLHLHAARHGGRGRRHSCAHRAPAAPRMLDDLKDHYIVCGTPHRRDHRRRIRRQRVPYVSSSATRTVLAAMEAGLPSKRREQRGRADAARHRPRQGFIARSHRPEKCTRAHGRVLRPTC